MTSAATPSRRPVCVIFTAQFSLFEAGLRTGDARKPLRHSRACSSKTPSIGYRLKPGARCDSRPRNSTPDRHQQPGLRDDEEIGPKGPNERRILVLGDSLVLSVQVPFKQTFGELLEQRLNATRPGTPTA